ncbi:hypothetical protein CW304_21445 [Bacillus sp. UFRGS-B20]|nr:hypothetical protein CW304_21445 [Bacillus sp. UFRGS-B20]
MGKRPPTCSTLLQIIFKYLPMRVQDIMVLVQKFFGVTKTEQKIPNELELYAVKPKVSWIRYTCCFWHRLLPWEVCLF